MGWSLKKHGQVENPPVARWRALCLWFSGRGGVVVVLGSTLADWKGYNCVFFWEKVAEVSWSFRLGFKGGAV